MTSIKVITIILLSVIMAGLLGAQTLQDSPDYQKSLQLRSQSHQAFDEGDYAQAKMLAEEAKVYADKADVWVAEQLAKFMSYYALKRVQRRFETVDRIKGKENFPEEYAMGTELYAKGNKEFDEENWMDSRKSAEQALAALLPIKYMRSESTLPAFYVINKWTNNKDCFWNIAKLDFIYSDPWSWKLLYEANKDKLPNRNNPDLIYPGTIIVIPERKGETRSGTWDNDQLKM